MKQICLIIAGVLLLLSFQPLLAQQIAAPEEAQQQPVQGPPFSQPVNPDLYLIRPGDELQVTFIQSQIEPLTLEVDPEGRVSDKTIGVFDLSNQTLTEARRTLQAALGSIYRVSDISISITRPRLVSISIRGSVLEPGVYNVFTSQRVSEVIELAGGILREGSSRLILLTGGPNRIEVDLDRARYMGDLESDPYVYAGYTIRVPNKSRTYVQVAGEVNKPRQIELLPNDDFRTLIRLAGGVRMNGDTSATRILRQSGPGSTENIKGGDIVLVPAKEENILEQPISIFGAVKSQGLYDFSPGMTLGDAIETAGGLLPEANQSHATVFRRPRMDEQGRLTELRYPIWNVTSDGNGLTNIPLQPLDSVFVPVKVGFVAVFGEVFNPGYFPYVPGKSALFYIQTAGGFLPTANKQQIAMYNPVSRITALNSPGVLVGDGATLTIDLKEELKSE